MNGFGGTLKGEIIRNILVTTKEASKLQQSLRFRGNSYEADALAAKATELSQQVDLLLQQSTHEEGVESSDTIVADLAQANALLQSSISKIEAGVAVAENLDKVMRYVDNVLVIAAKIAKAE